MDEPLAPIRRKLRATDLAALLRREIVAGKFQSNDPLPAERALAQLHGVSRGTVREALGRLERDRMVETRRGSGTYVLQPEPTATHSVFEGARPLELIDTRFALEPHICRLAVLHATPRDFERAEELMAVMEESAEDPIAFSEADTRFHIVLAESTSNSLLIWVMSQVSGVRNQPQWAAMRNVTLNPEIIATYNLQHRGVVEAIRRREPEQAAALMKTHLETARLTLTRAAAT